MSRQDDERFRVRQSTPKTGSRSSSPSIEGGHKSGGKSLRKSAGAAWRTPRAGPCGGVSPAALRSRAHARRVTIKTRLVNLKKPGHARSPRICATSNVRASAATANRPGLWPDDGQRRSGRLRGTRTGGSPPVPLHRLPRGCRAARGSAPLYPSPDEAHGSRSGDESGLGGGRSLEYRQPAYAYRAARQGRHRPGLDHCPRLHRPRDA